MGGVSLKTLVDVKGVQYIQPSPDVCTHCSTKLRNHPSSYASYYFLVVSSEYGNAIPHIYISFPISYDPLFSILSPSKIDILKDQACTSTTLRPKALSASLAPWKNQSSCDRDAKSNAKLYTLNLESLKPLMQPQP